MLHCFFFFNDTATTEIYTLSLHDALPICPGHPVVHRHRVRAELGQVELPVASRPRERRRVLELDLARGDRARDTAGVVPDRSEEHTSELQSRQYLVCRLLLEKKKTTYLIHFPLYHSLLLIPSSLLSHSLLPPHFLLQLPAAPLQQTILSSLTLFSTLYPLPAS